MTEALIGYTGFVGSTLRKQRPFDQLYRSTNVAEIAGKQLDLVVCAGAPAQKWLANRNPESDRRAIEGLIELLATIRCETFVLVSTVDVYKSPLSVTEDIAVDVTGLHAYGLHRRLLEQFVESQFPRHLIVRLPGLVGPGLRKNIVFDLLNENNLQAIDSRSVFQFYPTVNLWYDIITALNHELPLVHLTAEPVTVAEIAEQGFGRPFNQDLGGTPVRYDLRTKYAALFGGSGSYQYSKRESLQAVRTYAQSEPTSVKTHAVADR